MPSRSYSLSDDDDDELPPAELLSSGKRPNRDSVELDVGSVGFARIVQGLDGMNENLFYCCWK